SHTQLTPASAGRLEDNERVRRTLPASGRVNIDRQLPFLFVYRPPVDHPDAGTRDFVRGEASYLIAPQDRRYAVRTRALAKDVVATLSKIFGGCLVVEVWAAPDHAAKPEEDGTPQPPGFRLVAPRRFAEAPTVIRLKESLEKVVLFKQPASVSIVAGGRIGANGMATLANARELDELGADVLGLEI